MYPEVYCSTERRSFDLRSTFHLVFKTYKDKKKLDLSGKNPQNYTFERNEAELFFLVARYFLLVARCSLLLARCSLLFACYFLLVTRYFLLVTFCSLLATFCSLLFAHCSLLFACLLVAYCEPQKNGLAITKLHHRCFPCKFLRFS